jgi:hypothetical protein
VQTPHQAIFFKKFLIKKSNTMWEGLLQVTPSPHQRTPTHAHPLSPTLSRISTKQIIFAIIELSKSLFDIFELIPLRITSLVIFYEYFFIFFRNYPSTLDMCTGPKQFSGPCQRLACCLINFSVKLLFYSTFCREMDALQAYVF